MGSGTLLPDDSSRSAGHLIEDGRVRILLDCGSGVLHGLARDGKDWAGISHIALSHFHTDHVGDLAPLLWAFRHGIPAGRELPLTVLGPVGLAGFLRALAGAHGDYVLEPGYPLNVVEIPRKGRWTDPAGDLTVLTHPARHTPEAVALRIELPGGVVGYTGDTGPEPELGAFFERADVLIAECAVPDPTDLDLHLSPESLAVIARGARPRLLVATHLYPDLDPDAVPDLVERAGYTGRTVIGRDGLRIRLGSAEPEVSVGG